MKTFQEKTNKLFRAVVLLSIIGFINMSFSYGQDKSEGVISYKRIVNLHASLSPDQSTMKAMIPELSTTKFNLFYNDSYARLTEVKKSNMQGGVMLKTQSEEKIIDFKNKTTSELYTIMKKNYVVIDKKSDNENDKFKYTGESKTIAGFLCKKATLIRNDRKFELWISKDLPINVSPLGNLGIEGVVLEVKFDNVSFIAQEVKFKKVDTNLFKVPKDYREITPEQHEDLIEEELEEMQAGGGNVKVIKRH
jgi:GLPGLI family protein